MRWAGQRSHVRAPKNARSRLSLSRSPSLPTNTLWDPHLEHFELREICNVAGAAVKNPTRKHDGRCVEHTGSEGFRKGVWREVVLEIYRYLWCIHV